MNPRAVAMFLKLAVEMRDAGRQRAFEAIGQQDVALCLDGDTGRFLHHGGVDTYGAMTLGYLSQGGAGAQDRTGRPGDNITDFRLEFGCRSIPHALKQVRAHHMIQRYTGGDTRRDRVKPWAMCLGRVQQGMDHHSTRSNQPCAGHSTGMSVATRRAAMVQLKTRNRVGCPSKRRICCPSAVQLVVLMTETQA